MRTVRRAAAIAALLTFTFAASSASAATFAASPSTNSLVSNGRLSFFNERATKQAGRTAVAATSMAS